MMSLEVEEFFQRDVARFTESLTSLSREIAGDAVPAVDWTYDRLLAAISDVLSAASGLEVELAEDSRVLRSAQKRFRETIWPWFGQSAFMRHALEKPRGYAGDYMMLVALYDGQPRSTGLGGYLDLYFLNTELGRGVPLRLRMARQILLDEARQRSSMTVLDVASGPGREYVGGLGEPVDCQIKVTCVDLDLDALNHIQTTVVPTLPANYAIDVVQHNALKMTNGPANVEQFGQRDVVYSVGLCDYIPDRMMVRLLRGWRDLIAPGGLLYVGFKDSLKYDKTSYQWLVDWFFYQRTMEESRQLFAQAGYDLDQLDMNRDTTGSIINYIFRNVVEAPPENASTGMHEVDTSATTAVN